MVPSATRNRREKSSDRRPTGQGSLESARDKPELVLNHPCGEATRSPGIPSGSAVNTICTAKSPAISAQNARYPAGVWRKIAAVWRCSEQGTLIIMKMSLTRIATPCLGLVLACGGSQPAGAIHAKIPSAAAASKAGTPMQTATSGNVEVSPDILNACGLSDADAYFPFDSSRLEKQDVVPLNAVVLCFTAGALKGRSMKLVGHADPRGAMEYNITLGQARADGVQAYFEHGGLERAKAAPTSRGAMDATGTDEAGWTRDRRVDVVLAN